MPIIDLQRRLREIGRIRIGMQVPSEKGKMRPKKIDTFRLTSQDPEVLQAAAAIYGGKPQKWEGAPAGEQWELISEAAQLPIVIPPGGVAFSQYYELWSGGGCQRRCDGMSELISDGPCVCDPDERECKPHSRLSVMLRDLPGLGVWRLDTGGWYAAVELAGAVAFIEIAAAAGRMLPARLRLEQRQIKREGEPIKRFAVPVIDLDVTVASLAGNLSPAAPLEAGAVVELQAPRFSPIDPAALPAAPQQSISEQVSDVPQPRPSKPKRANAAAPLPSTGHAPRGEMSRGQLIAMRASEAGLSDDERHELISAVTRGRVSSSNDVSDDEAQAVFGAIHQIKVGALSLQQIAEISESAERSGQQEEAAPLFEAEPSPPAEEAGPKATAGQIRKIRAILNGLGAKKDADHLRIAGQLLDEEIPELSAMRAADAELLTDALKALSPDDLAIGAGDVAYIIEGGAA